MAVLLAVVCSAALTNGFVLSVSRMAPAVKGVLDVRIEPRDVKLSVGQSQLFFAVVNNGSLPFTYVWKSNSTFLGNNATQQFSFTTPSHYTILSVEVSDTMGEKGYDSVYVYDPASISIYLDDLPATATYTVKTDGTNYWAVRYDGYKAFEGTEATTLVQSVINTVNNNGVIDVGLGTFQLHGELLVNGTNENDPTKRLTLRGMGEGTIFNQNTAGANGIRVMNDAVVDLLKFKITMPSSNSGHGLYLSNEGGTSSTARISAQWSNLENIYVIGGDSTHYPIYLVNLYWSKVKTLWGRTTQGDAFVIENNSTSNRGNNVFENLHGYTSISSKYAFKILGTVGYNNLNQFNSIQYDSPGKGMLIKGGVSDNWFFGIDSEADGTQIQFEEISGLYGKGNTFQGYMLIPSGGTGINSTTTLYTFGGNKFDFHVIMASTTVGNYVLKDNVAYQPVNEYNLVLGNAVVSNIFSVTATSGYHPIIRWKSVAANGNMQLNPNTGSATLSDGSTITHRVGITPTSYWVSGSVAGEWVMVTAINSTTMTVSIKKCRTPSFFNDTFETNDLSQWTGTYFGNGTVATSSAYPANGTYSGLSTLTTNVGAYGLAYKNVTNVNNAYIRDFVRFNATPTVNQRGITLMMGTSNTGANFFWAGIFNDAGTIKWFVYYRNATTHYRALSTGASPVANTYYTMEMKQVLSSGATYTGEYRLFINGVERITLTGVDTSNVGSSLKQIKVGAYNGDGANTTTLALQVYFDGVVGSDEYIGSSEEWKNVIYRSGATQTVYWYAAWYP